MYNRKISIFVVIMKPPRYMYMVYCMNYFGDFRFPLHGSYFMITVQMHKWSHYVDSKSTVQRIKRLCWKS